MRHCNRSQVSMLVADGHQQTLRNNKRWCKTHRWRYNILLPWLWPAQSVTGFCLFVILLPHYDDVIMGAIASQITSLTIVYSAVNSGADQSKHQSSASLAFVWGIHRGSVNSPHQWPVTRKMFPFDDVIMFCVARVPLGLLDNVGNLEILDIW